MLSSSLLLLLGAAVAAPAPGTVHAVCGPTACTGAGLCLDWPLDGVPSVDWVIGNHVDLAVGTSATLDFRGWHHTYDEHAGTDIAVPNMRWVDLEVPVYAAAAGTVIAVQDGFFDRNVERTGSPANYVWVEHANGWVTKYHHLKKDRMEVAVGDPVTTRSVLGYVASSGNSTAAHLHFQVEHDGWYVDPFNRGMWNGCEPDYERPFAYMASSFQAGTIEANLKEARRPPALDVTTISSGGVLGIGLSAAGGDGTDVVESCVSGPGGFLACKTHTTGAMRSPWHGKLWWRHNVHLDGPTGTYWAIIWANGSIVDIHPVNVVP